MSNAIIFNTTLFPASDACFSGIIAGRCVMVQFSNLDLNSTRLVTLFIGCHFPYINTNGGESVSFSMDRALSLCLPIDR